MNLLLVAVFVIFISLSCTKNAHSPVKLQSGQNRLDAKLRFVAIGDTGTGQTDQYKMAEAIKSHCDLSGCDFILLLGDNFYPIGVTSPEDPQWDSKFVKPYKDISIPFYVSLGNHDYGNAKDWDRGRQQVLYSQKNSKWILPNEHYTFEKAGVVFFALDSHRLINELPGTLQEQQNTFEDALHKHLGDWKIAFGHHPIISNGTHGSIKDSSHLKKLFDNTFCAKLDFYIAGHEHQLALYPGPHDCEFHQVVAGGGGAGLYGFSGTKPSLFQAKSFGFAYFEVEKQIAKIQFVNSSGETLYKREIPKRKE